MGLELKTLNKMVAEFENGTHPLDRSRADLLQLVYRAYLFGLEGKDPNVDDIVRGAFAKKSDCGGAEC